MTAAERDREQQIVVVDAAVAIVIERREILDQLDAALLEHAKVEQRVDAFDRAADSKRVRPTDERRVLGNLQAGLIRLLRHPERRTVLNARKRVLRERRHRLRVVVVRADAHLQVVDSRRSAARPRTEHAVVTVLCGLPLRLGPDRPLYGTGGRVGGLLAGIAHHEPVGTNADIAPQEPEPIVERRRREGCRDSSRRRVTPADQHRAILVAEFTRGKPERLVAHKRPANGAGHLLPIEWLRRRCLVERRGARRPGVLACEQRRAAAQRLLPERVTTLMADDADRPSSAPNRLVAIWNSCTASIGRFMSGPPTTSSLLSCASMLMLPPRPSWPADEISTLLVFVGSKVGVG